jgi:hypothetical protein
MKRGRRLRWRAKGWILPRSFSHLVPSAKINTNRGRLKIHFGDCNPGELAQSSIWAAVLAWKRATRRIHQDADRNQGAAVVLDVVPPSEGTPYGRR